MPVARRMGHADASAEHHCVTLSISESPNLKGNIMGIFSTILSKLGFGSAEVAALTASRTAIADGGMARSRTKREKDGIAQQRQMKQRRGSPRNGGQPRFLRSA